MQGRVIIGVTISPSYPLQDDVCGLNAIVERQHPYRDGCRRIEIAEAQPVSSNIGKFPRRCGPQARLAPPYGLREDRRVPDAHGSVAILLEKDAAGNSLSVVLAKII
jgi:hypothetical protein